MTLDKFLSRRSPGFSTRAGTLWALLAVATAISSLMTAEDVSAQPDPFAPPAGGSVPDPFAPGGAPPPGGGSPFGAPPPAVPTTSPQPAAGAKDETVDEALARKVLEQNPQTVDELMRAIQNLSNLGRPKLVKTLVDKVVAANLNEAQQADLAQRWGAGLFAKLALEADNELETRRFAQAVLDAARKRQLAAPRLAQLVNDLSSDDPAERRTAIRELRAAGQAIYAPLVSYLGSPDKSAQHPRVVAAAAQIGELVDPAMVASLDASNETLQVQAARVLAHRNSRRALPALLGYAFSDQTAEPLQAAAQQALRMMLGGMPSRQEAVTYLERRAREHQAGVAVGGGDISGQLANWRWDDKSQTVVADYLLPRDVSILREERVARALYSFAPDSEKHLLLRLMTGLAAAKVRGGIDSPVNDSAILQLCERAGSETVAAALRRARNDKRVLAAAAAAEVLGELGDSNVLFGSGRPSVLCDSLNASDPRVRAAALSSVMKLATAKPFWGSSVAMERMTQAVTAAGTHRAVVGHPDESAGQTWAGMLIETGVEADTARNGGEVVHTAMQHVDYEIVLLSSRIQGPQLRETIQRLREQPTCQHLPIGIICKASDIHRYKDFAMEYERVEAFPEPYTSERMASIYERLIATYAFPPITPNLKVQQGLAALTWLASVADQPGKYGYFDLERAQAAAIAALPLRASSAEAARVLGKIGNRRSQIALIDLASIATLPMVMRRASVAAFKEAVERRGLMLYSHEVNQQYQRYNQSENLPRETQLLLGEALDIIESTIPRSALSGTGS